jgi:cell division septal protein FtsQ
VPPGEPNPRRRVLAVAVGATVLGLGAIGASYSPLFRASDVRVTAPGIPRADVLAIAGVDDRTNVFHLDETEVERRLEDDPRVLEARVTTSLPSQVRIRVTPRRPVAFAGSPAELIGADGTVIGPAGGALPSLPELIGTDVGTGAAAAAAMAPGLRSVVEEIAVGSDGAIVVSLEAGFTADLGDATELRAKAASLAAILRWAAEEEVRIVSADVSVPGSPTARLEEGETAVPSG